MKLRLPLLLRLALLSTAAAYTLGSGCLFADDAPADATEQDAPIAEAVEDDDAALMPTIGFEGYTESQLVDIQSSDAVGAVIHGVLENSTTGAVANVGTTTSSSNGATPVAESPALTLSAPAEPATDSALTTSTLSDSAGEGAVAPFFSAEEAAALVVASPATSTPSIKSASTATLTSSDESDETTSSSSATGAVSSSIGSVGTASAGGAGASSGGGSASYSLTSSSSDSSSISLVITTPTDDTSSDPIAEEVLEDSTTEETTTTSTLPDSSASSLAGTSSTTTTRTLPQMKLLGATGDTGDLTWTNASGDGIWNTNSVNWSSGESSVAFTDGANVIFSSSGSNGIKLGENITAGTLAVSAGSYTLSADSSLSLNAGAVTISNGGALSIGEQISANFSSLNSNGCSVTVGGTATVAEDTKLENAASLKGTGCLTTKSLKFFAWGNQTVEMEELVVTEKAIIDAHRVGVTIKNTNLTLSEGLRIAMWSAYDSSLTFEGSRVNLGSSNIRLNHSVENSRASVEFKGSNTIDVSGLSDNFIAFLEFDENITEDRFYETWCYYQVVGNDVLTTLSEGTQLKVVVGDSTYSSVKTDTTRGGLALGIQANDVYFLKTKGAYSTSTVKNTQGITAGSTKLYVTNGNTLTIDDGSFALPSIFGEGDVVLATNATLTNTDLSHVTGKLTINSGVTLTLGTDDRQEVDIGSFSAIDLAGNISASNKKEILNNVCIAQGNTGSIYSVDMGDAPECMTLAGTTTVIGDLRMGSLWNAQFKIEKLTGTGTLKILGSNWGTSSSQSATYDIKSVSEFRGELSVENSSAEVNVTLGTENANVAADFTKTNGTLNLTVDATTTLSGKVSGAAITINEGKALDITGKVTTSESVTNSGSLTVSFGGTLTGNVSGSLTVSSGGVFVGDVSGGTFTLNGVWDLRNEDDHSSGKLAAFLAKVSEGSGTLKFSAGGTNAYVLGGDVNTGGLDLSFVGSEHTEINGWKDTKAVLSISKESTLSTEGELRVESTATVKVESGGIVEVGGVLKLGHDQASNYGHFLLDGGQLIAQEVERTNPSDAVDSSKNTFRMSGGTLTLTKENAEISGVYTEISGGTLDTSKAAWGINSSDASVGGVTVSDVKDGEGGNSGHALTLTGAKITGDITLDGKAGLILKDVTVTGESVTLGGDDRTVQVASGDLTVANSVTTKGNLEVATGNDLVVKGTYATSGADSSLKLQGEATASLQKGDTVVATVSQNGTEADASATITGGVTMKYDSTYNKAIIAGAGSGSLATITNSLLTVASGSTLSLQNVILAGNTKISAGTAAAAAVALSDEGSGESASAAPTVDLSGSVIQLSQDNATPKTEGVKDLTKGSILTKTGPAGGEGNTLAIQQNPAKVYTIDYTGATGVTLTGALTFDFDTFTVEGMTGSGYYLLNELLKEYDYVALRFADDVTVDPEKVAVTSKVTMGTETVTSAGYYAGGTNGVVNSNGTSGVVVYFDAMALPEPTTSTLGLLALAALCARRRRSRTRAHAE